MSLKSAFLHFKTITRHRHKVIAHCAKAGILWQGLCHDLSKYSPTEFIPGVKFCTGTRSPNEGEREAYGYSLAWMHHKGRNRHHFEYWTDYNPKAKRVEPVKMPLRFVVEMFCDRVAASKIYQGKNYKSSHPLEYFEMGRSHRIIHPETSALLEKLLRMLAEKGEEEAFAYIRGLIKRNKNSIDY
ncbi:MAG: catalase [Oscillospiraceae bacterium]|nr:catalase [Oscillospiraceae bacterium]